MRYGRGRSRWPAGALALALALPAATAAQFADQSALAQDEDYFVIEVPEVEAPPPLLEVGVAGAAAAAEIELPDDPALERIVFELPFTDETGGGLARGSSGALEYLREDYVVASEGVEVAYRDLQFRAERIEVDLATKRLTAVGQVILDQGPRRLTGQTLEFDLETETGTLTDAQAFVDPDVYFTGETISKIGENEYKVVKGMMTSCSDRVPDWSFKMGTGRVVVDGYARIRNTRMRVKKLPVFYTPYLLFPTNRDRKSGLLMPSIGTSRDRGKVLSLSYFQTLGKSFDATLYSDLYEEDHFGLGLEFRYQPTVSTGGNFFGYAIDDPVAGETRWKMQLDHVSQRLPFGMRGVIRALKFSDFDYFREYERDFNNISLRSVASAGYVTGNWGSHSFNFVLSDNETFIRNGVSVIQRQLPEIEYRLRSTRLGPLPVYLDLQSSAHYFNVQRTGLIDENYQRADLAPSLTVPLSYWPWLSVSVTGAGRVTWYGNSSNLAKTEFTGESITRVFPSASAQIVGPSFSRIFDMKIGRFDKFKHIIEPRFSYLFIGESDEQQLVPLFDEIDILLKQNIFTVALVNRVLAKSEDPDSLEGAREIFSFQLAQSYSLNEDQPFQRSRDGSMETTKGPLSGQLRFAPGNRVNFESRFLYNTLFGELESSSLTGGLAFGSHRLGTTWYTRFNPETGETTSNQARLFASLQLIRNRLRLDGQVNYDLVQGLLQHHRYMLAYQSQCYGLALEFVNLRSLTRSERDIRFAISLKNIGTFLDLNSRSRTTY